MRPEDFERNLAERRRGQPSADANQRIVWAACAALIALALAGIVYFVLHEVREEREERERAQEMAKFRAMLETTAQPMTLAEHAQAWSDTPAQPRPAAPFHPTVPPGFRCIGHDLFKVLPNGYQQMPTNDAHLFCYQK